MRQTSAERSLPRARDERSILRTSLIRFGLLSLLALVVLGTGIQLVSRHVAGDEALRDARNRSEGFTHGVAAPLVNAAVRRGDREATSLLASAMENRIREGAFKHVLIFDRQGRVIWSDVDSVVGSRHDLTNELDAAFETGDVLSSLPGEDEDRHTERVSGEALMVEVYVGARDANDAPFLFEALIPPDRIAADRTAILKELLPVGLGGLLLFQLAILPMAYSLALRVDRAQRHRSDLLRRSLLSWHEERRHLAQELHDGVVQDLSAASYALPSVVKQLPADRSADAARATVERIGDLLQQDLRAMRSLVFDLLPADLGGMGLLTALQALAKRHSDAGLAVHLDVASDLDVGPETAGLVYRVLREGLRNVERHARAENAWVRIGRHDEVLEVVLSDDGRGLGPAKPDQEGHFGLRLLNGLVADVGGTLDLHDGVEGGAVMRVTAPAVLSH